MKDSFLKEVWNFTLLIGGFAAIGWILSKVAT